MVAESSSAGIRAGIISSSLDGIALSCSQIRAWAAVEGSSVLTIPRPAPGGNGPRSPVPPCPGPAPLTTLAP